MPKEEPPQSVQGKDEKQETKDHQAVSDPAEAKQVVDLLEGVSEQASSTALETPAPAATVGTTPTETTTDLLGFSTASVEATPAPPTSAPGNVTNAAAANAVQGGDLLMDPAESAPESASPVVHQDDPAPMPPTNAATSETVDPIGAQSSQVDPSTVSDVNNSGTVDLQVPDATVADVQASPKVDVPEKVQAEDSTTVSLPTTTTTADIPEATAQLPEQATTRNGQADKQQDSGMAQDSTSPQAKAEKPQNGGESNSHTEKKEAAAVSASSANIPANTGEEKKETVTTNEIASDGNTTDNSKLATAANENAAASKPTAFGTSDSTSSQSSITTVDPSNGDKNKEQGIEKSVPSEAFVEAQQKAERLKKELHAAQELIAKLQNRDKEELLAKEKLAAEQLVAQLQATLQTQMTAKAEAEDLARRTKAQFQKLEQELGRVREEGDTKMKQMNDNLDTMMKEREAMKTELDQIREERDEQARKEAALTSRLNAAKKKEGVKANQADLFQDQVQGLQDELALTNAELSARKGEIEQLKQDLVDVKEYSKKRIKQLESSLTGERKLNDERKQKMKAFVEAKMEEVRVAKSEHSSFQTELDQSNRSLTDLNQRMKQLHAQWVQSQTRNRELQRDMAKMKKDSEMMHKVGGTLEMKLSKSAQETEEHKNKRLTAKNELMNVLKQVEAERDLNNRLRDSIKFTFTPKALSQQQTMQEALDEFEIQLERVAKRFGRTLIPPPTAGPSYTDMAFESTTDGEGGDNGADDAISGEVTSPPSAQEANATRLLSKLEQETQHVSQLIMTLSNSLERLENVLSGPSNRSCVSVLQEILLASTAAGTGNGEERAAMNAGAAEYA